MSQFTIVLNQIGVFILMLACGVAARKLKLVGEETLYGLSQISIKIALPAFIFDNTVNHTTKEDLIQSLPVLLLAAGYFVLLFLLSVFLEKAFRLKGNQARVFRLCLMFGNAGLIGLPLANELYPERAILYISMTSIVEQVLIWTYGVTLSYDVKDTSEGAKISLKRMKNMLSNPVLISIAVSIVFVVCNWELPGFVNTAFSKLSNLLMPLGLIYMGAMLSFKDIKAALKRKEIFAEIGLKMVLLPFLIYVAVKAAGFPLDMAGTLSIIIGVPSFLISIMLVKNNGSDHDYCIGMVMLTTIACLITYPILSLLNSMV